LALTGSSATGACAGLATAWLTVIPGPSRQVFARGADRQLGRHRGARTGSTALHVRSPAWLQWSLPSHLVAWSPPTWSPPTWSPPTWSSRVGLAPACDGQRDFT